jgi:uncharacterized membrane protein YedE/YeeE
MNIKKIIAGTGAIVAFNVGILATTIAIVPGIIAAPAQAGWQDWIPVPSGIYLNLGGKELFYGDYAETGVPLYQGSVWEVRSNGKIIAHGYGEVPKWVFSLIARIGPAIRAE